MPKLSQIVPFAMVAAILVTLLTLGIPFVLSQREAARGTQWRNNLKQIGLAMHNYHDTFNMFPPGGIFREDGTPMHGWMWSIMPYVESNAFFSSIDSNTPWDDRSQLARFFQKNCHADYVYSSPSVRVARRDPMVRAHMAANSWILHRNSSVGVKSINDTAHTMLVADSSEPYDVFGSTYNWRDPELERNSRPQAFGNIFSDGTYVLLADGSVTLVPLVDNERWKSLRGREELRPKPQNVERPTEAWELGDRPHDPVRIWQPGDGK